MKTCTDKYTASTCMTGYIVNSKTCIKCGTGEATCTALKATSCNAGYFLSAGVCTACNSNTNVDACYNSDANMATGCIAAKFLSSGACSNCAGNTQ